MSVRTASVLVGRDRSQGLRVLYFDSYNKELLEMLLQSGRCSVREKVSQSDSIRGALQCSRCAQRNSLLTQIRIAVHEEDLEH
jgi:hypothetical protein